MTFHRLVTDAQLKVPHAPEGVASIWHEFHRQRQTRANNPGIRARATLTQPERDQRQFVIETGSGHHLLTDDAVGATGSSPVELLAAALAASAASEVITRLRARKDQLITGYEVRVEAEQAERAPKPLVLVRIHHVVTGRGIDAAAVNEAIHNAEEKNCPVEALLKMTASITTTFETVEERAD